MFRQLHNIGMSIHQQRLRSSNCDSLRDLDKKKLNSSTSLTSRPFLMRPCTNDTRRLPCVLLRKRVLDRAHCQTKLTLQAPLLSTSFAAHFGYISNYFSHPPIASPLLVRNAKCIHSLFGPLGCVPEILNARGDSTLYGTRSSAPEFDVWRSHCIV